MSVLSKSNTDLDINNINNINNINKDNKMSQLTQEELLSVLRSLLKTTANDLLERNRLYEIERVAALFSHIHPETWKKALIGQATFAPVSLISSQ